MGKNIETQHLPTDVQEFLDKVPDGPNIEEEETRRFLGFIETNYPNGEWRKNKIMKAEMELFLSSLKDVQHKWARNAENKINESKTKIQALNASLGSSTFSEHNENMNKSAFISSKLPEGVSHSDVLTLAYKEIGKPLTAEKIKSWQEEQGIGVDGKIGKETYLEMRAGQLLAQAKYKIDEFGISKKTQKEILWAFEHGSKTGENMLALLTFLTEFKTKNENTPEFEEDYGGLYKGLDIEIKKFQKSPEGENLVKETVEAVKKGNGAIGDLMPLLKQEITGKEYVENNGGQLKLAGLAGFIFFGNKIPGFEKIPGMGSWFTRILWLIGGAALGGTKFLGDLFDEGADLFESGKAYTQSDRFKEDMDKGRTWFNDTWNSMTSAETYNIGAEKAQEIFGDTLTNMASLNESFKEGEGGKFIEQFSGKSMLIMSDKSFLNATKDRIASVETLEQLSALMSPSKFEELKKIEPKMTDEEVQSFIKNHIQPLIKDAEDGDMLKKSIWYRHAQSALEGLTFNESGSLNTNPKIDAYLRNEFATIINGRGSETLKEAARKLAAATQYNKVESYNIDEEFASLSAKEKGIIESLKKKLEAIGEVQGYISDQVAHIQTIEVKTEGIPDTPITLKDDMQDLIALGAGFEISEELARKSGISVEDYDRSTFDTALNAKRMEILVYADTLGITSIANISDIKGELQKVEQEKETIVLKQNMQENIDNLEKNIPGDWTTPIRMREWWEENSKYIRNLETLSADIPDGQTELQSQVTQALETKANFVKKYKELRNGIKNEIAALETEIQAINTETTDIESYRVARLKLVEIGEKYDGVITKVIPSWDNQFGTDFVSSVFSYFSDDTKSPFEEEKTNNSIEFLDTEISDLSGIDIRSIETAIGDTIRELEASLVVTIDTSAVDVMDVSSLDAFKNAVTKTDAILGEIIDPDIKVETLKKLETEVSRIEQLFIEKIGKIITPVELRKLRSIYVSEFKGFLLANGNVAPWHKRRADGKDIVDLAIEERKVKIEEEEERVQREAEDTALYEKRKQYFDSQSTDKEGFYEIAIINAMRDTDVVKDIFKDVSENDTFSITLTKVMLLLNTWLLDDNIEQFHNDIQATIDAFNELADTQINK